MGLFGGIARCQQLLGKIVARQGQQELAEHYFEEAMQIFRDCGARLECANTLYDYGVALMDYRSAEKNRYQQGLNYLNEARQVFGGVSRCSGFAAGRARSCYAY